MKKISRNHTVLLLAGSCAVLVLAFIAIEQYELASMQAYRPIPAAAILTPEQQAALWKPISAATSSRLTDADFKNLTKPMPGGIEITDKDKAALFRSMQPDSN